MPLVVQDTRAAPLGTPKWLTPAPPPGQQEPLPSTKRLNHLGGALVQDPVPAGLRGQKPEGLLRHFPKHLMAKALQLQGERDAGGAGRK